MRKEIFPDLPDDMIILGNFNQLYKVNQPFILRGVDEYDLIANKI